MNIKPILDRIEADKPKALLIPDGWLSLVVELDQKIAALAPEYTIREVQYRNGCLNYKVSNIPEAKANQVQLLINKYENKSYSTPFLP